MKGILVQFLATIIVIIPTFQAGFGIAWTSYTLTLLKSEQTPLNTRITTNEGSLIGSLPMIGCVLGTLVGGFLTDPIGRKKTSLLSGLCAFVFKGTEKDIRYFYARIPTETKNYTNFACYTLARMCWSIISVTNSVPLLLTGRFIGGLSSGIQSLVVYIFINEYSQMSIRGTLPSLAVFAYSFGILSSYFAGWLCSYMAINYINMVLSGAFLICLLTFHETPAYLLSKGKHEEALASLQFYRGETKPTPAILEEIDYFRSQRQPASAVDEDVNNGKDLEKSSKETHALMHDLKFGDNAENSNAVREVETSAWRILRSSKELQRSMITVSLLLSLAVFMGLIALQAYAGPLFHATAPNYSPHICSIALAVAIALGSGISFIITDLVGRRVLFLSSCISTTVTMGLLASLVQWSWGPEWTAPLLILLINFGFQMGACNIPFVQLSESFPTETKSLASMIALCALFSSLYVVLAVYDPLVGLIGLAGTLLVFTLLSALTTIVGHCIMKETKGVPIDDIQTMYAEGYLCRRLKK